MSVQKIKSFLALLCRPRGCLRRRRIVLPPFPPIYTGDDPLVRENRADQILKMVVFVHIARQNVLFFW